MRRKTISRTIFNASALLAMPFLAASLLAVPASADKTQKTEWTHSEEGKAYHIQGGNRQSVEMKSYMRKLSPGGKIYFLACRRDWQEALDGLAKFSRNSTGSALYVKAYCLEKLKRHEEAIKTYAEAKSKVDMVFDPGFKFYFHFADAQINAGQLRDALKNLDIAESKYKTAVKYGYTGQAAFNMMRRIKYVILEKDGQYEKAFKGYCHQLDPHNKVFNLNEKLDVTPAKCAEAEKFLKENRKVPPSDITNDYVDYLFSTGNALLILGKTAEAKEFYKKLDRYKPWYEVKKTKIVEEDSFFKEVKRNAQLALLKLAYQEKDFKECCEQMRRFYATFGADPVEYAEHRYAVVSMKDVPQLVTQQDVDLHSPMAETILDRKPLVSNEPRENLVGAKREAFLKRVKRRHDLYSADPLLAKAHNQVLEGKFSRCYTTLDQFLRSNSVLSTEHQGYDEGQKSKVFDRHYVYKARLLQLAVGYGAGMKSQSLSFRIYSEPQQSLRWRLVEARLLGKMPSNTDADAKKFRDDPEFQAWCHFAAAVHGMSKKEYARAAKEFGMVQFDDEIVYLSDFSRILKMFCEKQK